MNDQTYSQPQQSADISIDSIHIPATARTDSLQVSHGQWQIWLFERSGARSRPLTTELSLSGRLDRDALRTALDRIVARHAILRTTFREIAGEPAQFVANPTIGISLSEHDAPSEGDLLQIVNADALAPFDLSAGPLIRAQLIRLSFDEHVLLLTLHPIIADYASLGILLRELAADFTAIALNRDPSALDIQLQYCDYSAWQRQRVSPAILNKQMKYWTERLANAPALQLPVDQARRNQHGHAHDQMSLKLPTVLARRLAQLARQQRISLFVIQLSCWAAVLSRWAGQDEVTIGTVLATRPSGALGSPGPFDNTAALRIGVNEATSAEHLFKQVKAALADAHAHADVPFARVSEILAPSRNNDPLLRVQVTLDDASAMDPAKLQFAGLKLRSLSMNDATTAFDLSLAFTESTGTLTYACDLFDKETIERLAACSQTLLRGMAKHVRRPLGRISMLPATESEQVLHRFNATAAPLAQDPLVHVLFEEQARLSPTATAVEYEDQSLTYAELNGRANQLARYLRGRGIGAGELVGICVERSIEMVVGLLGILKTGAAYVPLDPNYPTERLAYMLENAAPAIVLTQERLRTALPATSAEVVDLDRQWPEIGRHPPEDSANKRALDANNPVYVIYTSGSTGEPKGVEMRHRSMVNLIEWHRQSFPQDTARVLQFAALSFDVAFQETFTTLCTGGALVLIDEWVRRDAQALIQVLCRRSIQRLFLPPLVLQSLAEHSVNANVTPTDLRDVITAGEQLRISAEIVTFFQKQEGCRLHNHYGPTETHVVTALTLEGDPAEWPALPTIGRPIANTQIYILDGQRQPMPIGLAGEIYIGGANVARGYLHRSELTQERFIPDPFSADPQARLYKTGDLARWRADGTLEYLGRNDDQVKIRGYRVELAEIETQLARHADVRETTVIACEDAHGAKYLVAYVTLRGGADATIEGLRAHVSERVPQFMVPSAFVILERMPATASGKVDRRALPAPELSITEDRIYEPAIGEAEETLARIWQVLLRVGRAGRQDNFFALGGDSLTMARMMEQLRQAGWTVDVRSAFAKRTLADLASVLTRDIAEEPPIPPNLIPFPCSAITPQMLPLVELTQEQIDRIARSVPGGVDNIQDIYPLAPLQQGLLFHHLFSDRGGDAYVVPTLLSVESRARLDGLLAAIQMVIDRHDALRTAVLWDELPQPVQVVYRKATLPVEQVVLDAGDAWTQVQDWMKPENQKIDLRQAPLLRVRIASQPLGDNWYVLLQLHHLTGDNVSQEIVRSEILAHLQDEAQSLPATLPYRNHVAYALACARSQDAEIFFRDKLAGLDETAAPFGLTDVRGDGSGEEARQKLAPELTKRVQAQVRALGMSAATLFHAAWAIVIAQSSVRDDVVFGTVLLGRLQSSSDTQRMLGMFINTLPLRVRLQNVTALQLVEQTQRELADLLIHEHTSLALAQRCSPLAGSAPLFTTLLNYRHGVRGADADWVDTTGIHGLAHRERTNYPITLSIDDSGKDVALTAQTDGRVDPERIIGYMSAAVRSLLAALEAAPHTRALSMSILPAAERRQVVELFNATRRPYPSDAFIHEVFEQQALRTPDAIAVVYEHRELTYAQLNAKANQLAAFLLTQGVQSGALVPIIMERNLLLVIAQLAILKCGGVYVPMDWNLPAERLTFMIGDCGASHILSDRAREPVADAAVNWIDCAALESVIGQLPAENLSLPLHPPAAAYVMYTSGSTGVPKGVLVAHHGVLRLVINSDYVQIGPEDCFSHCSNPAFDASTFEIWGALLNGAKVLVVPQSVVLDATRLAAVLLQQRVTVLWLTIGLFTSYVDALAEVFPRLRYLMTGGDVVDPQILGAVLRNSRPKHLISAYGPTESTTFTTTYEVESVAASASSLPIGRPISNTQVYILDARRQPAPIGVPGEIYIGGAGVALGYLNRPELTAQRFLPDPFSHEPRALIYKSGDLGRWRPDGHIEFLGRNDGQIKLRGFRIEPGEIEAALTHHPQVKQAAVIVRTDPPGDKRLVAYIVAQAGSSPTVADLREYLVGALPEYMVPGAIVTLEELPLTANGKLDRLALPAPALAAYVSHAYEPPDGEAEQIIAGILAELLHIERVGRDDDFFELGGHSLLAMQVVVHIRSLLALELPISTLFDFPTVRQLAAHIEPLREDRMRNALAADSEDVTLLLERVAAMSHSEVQALMRELRSGERA